MASVRKSVSFVCKDVHKDTRVCMYVGEETRRRPGEKEKERESASRTLRGFSLPLAGENFNAENLGGETE